MTVGEAVKILMECEPDRNLYIQDGDGTAQIVTAIGDLQHVGEGIAGVRIPDDVYLMTARQYDAFAGEDD